jgi:hypothetical protein
MRTGAAVRWGLVVFGLLMVGYALTAEYNACRYEGSI